MLGGTIQNHYFHGNRDDVAAQQSKDAIIYVTVREINKYLASCSTKYVPSRLASRRSSRWKSCERGENTAFYPSKEGGGAGSRNPYDKGSLSANPCSSAAAISLRGMREEVLIMQAAFLLL